MLTERQKQFIRNLEDKDLSPEIKYSTSTGKFYMTSRLLIKQGSLLGGICEHRENPEDAVDAYMKEVTRNNMVADVYGLRKEFCFVEVAQ